jgi:hypothetical protein
MNINDINNLFYFYETVRSHEHLKEIPLSDLEGVDIEFLQKTSVSANFDGLMLTLGVDFCMKKLVVQFISPDRRSKPLLSSAESPDSTIYISKSADPKDVLKTLREISDRYSSLTPPPFDRYNDDTGPGGEIHKVPADELPKGNLRAKYKHEIFMRDHNMHEVVIPAGYKFKLIK